MSDKTDLATPASPMLIDASRVVTIEQDDRIPTSLSVG